MSGSSSSLGHQDVYRTFIFLGRILDKPLSDTRRVRARIETNMNAFEETMSAPVKVLTRDQVAKYLGVAPKTLANWYSSGIGPPVVKLHGFVRYDEAEFVAWYEAKKAVA